MHQVRRVRRRFPMWQRFELRAGLEQAVAELDEAKRSTFILFEVEGLPVAEIAGDHGGTRRLPSTHVCGLRVHICVSAYWSWGLSMTDKPPAQPEPSRWV